LEASSPHPIISLIFSNIFKYSLFPLRDPPAPIPPFFKNTICSKKFLATQSPKKVHYKYLKGDTMLDNIKNFVKSVTPITWILVAVGVVAVVVLTLSATHAKAPAAAPAAVEAPAAK
jgi:hypothetical protein